MNRTEENRKKNPSYSDTHRNCVNAFVWADTSTIAAKYIYS